MNEDGEIIENSRTVHEYGNSKLLLTIAKDLESPLRSCFPSHYRDIIAMGHAQEPWSSAHKTHEGEVGEPSCIHGNGCVSLPQYGILIHRKFSINLPVLQDIQDPVPYVKRNQYGEKVLAH